VGPVQLRPALMPEYIEALAAVSGAYLVLPTPLSSAAWPSRNRAGIPGSPGLPACACRFHTIENSCPVRNASGLSVAGLRFSAPETAFAPQGSGAGANGLHRAEAMRLRCSCFSITSARPIPLLDKGLRELLVPHRRIVRSAHYRQAILARGVAHASSTAYSEHRPRTAAPRLISASSGLCFACRRQ